MCVYCLYVYAHGRTSYLFANRNNMLFYGKMSNDRIKKKMKMKTIVCIYDKLQTYYCGELYYTSEEVVIKTYIGIRPCGFIDFFHVFTHQRFLREIEQY